MHGMNWDDARIFLAVVRAGSLTGGAARLGINQSTASRRLSALEASLGARLVNRRAGGVRLTGAGEEFLLRAEAAAAAFTEIESQLGGRDERLSGPLRLTCTDNFANRYLAPHLARFARLHPGIDLTLITRYEHLSLARREADVAIRTTTQPAGTLVGRRLARFALAVYGAPGLVAALPAEPDPATLGWIGWSNEAYSRLMITDHFPTASIRHVGDSNLDIATMIRAGLGVGVTGCFSGDTDPGLRRVYPDRVIESGMDLWILSHPDLARVARVRALKDFIAETMLADRALFEGRRPEAFRDAARPAVSELRRN